MARKYSDGAREIIKAHLQMRKGCRKLPVTYDDIPYMILFVYRCNAFISLFLPTGVWTNNVPSDAEIDVWKLDVIYEYWRERIYADTDIWLEQQGDAHTWLSESEM